jgi:ABC-2 type transport system ATP-binding protein
MNTIGVDPGARSETTIELRGLTKKFGATVAVDDLTASISAGRVTAFLGPNGAGKTTTLRMLLGLVAPTAGTATIAGRRYDEFREPVREVGALLEAPGFHPGRTAFDHVRAVAVAARLPRDAPARVLAEADLMAAADQRVGSFSLGMRQRLGLAVAVLGDPPVLVLDEPTNGLDPQGIRWLRGHLRRLADHGRTVLVSSHVLAEVEQIADDVLVIVRGRLVRSASLAALRAEARAGLRVRSPQTGRLCGLLKAAGYGVCRVAPAELAVDGATPETVGELAARHQIVLHGLVAIERLEEVFIRLTEEVHT